MTRGPDPTTMKAPFGRASIPAAIALLAVAAVVVFLAAPRGGHHALVSVSPAAGSIAEIAPAAVELRFDQPAIALGTQVRVIGPGGAQLSTGPAVLVDSAVSVQLASARPAGTYTVEWRVTSTAGHPLSGAFHFTAAGSVGTSATAQPGAVGPTEPSVDRGGAEVARAATGSSDDPPLRAIGVGGAGLVLLTGVAVWWLRRTA